MRTRFDDLGTTGLAIFAVFVIVFGSASGVASREVPRLCFGGLAFVLFAALLVRIARAVEARGTRRRITIDASRVTIAWLALTLRGVEGPRVIRARLAERDIEVRVGPPSFFGPPRFVVRVPARVKGPGAAAELARALASLGVATVAIDGDHVVIVTRSLAGSLGADTEGERLLRIAKRVIALTPPLEEQLLVRAREPDGTARCPYCHDEVGPDASRTECRKCGSAHHRDCFEEHGRCAIFGCGAFRHGAAGENARVLM